MENTTKVKEVKNEEYKERNLLVDFLVLFLVFIGSSIISAFLAGPLYGILFNPSDVSQEAVLADPRFMLANLLMTFLVIIALRLFGRYFQKRSLVSLGFKSDKKIENSLFGIVIGLISAILVTIVAVATGNLRLTYRFNSIDKFVFGLFILAWIFQGFSEEVLYRSLIQKSVSEKYGAIPAVIVSSIIFMLFHLGNESISPLALVNLFLMSVLSSLLFIRTNDIFISGFFHALWNMSQANFFGISVSGMDKFDASIFESGFSKPSILNGGDFGLEGSIITTVIFILVILALYFMNKNKEANK